MKQERIEPGGTPGRKAIERAKHPGYYRRAKDTKGSKIG